ncbi:hypothetical protein NBRC111893_663 [Lentilactobacillus kosonis]|uniref:Uncharacterized protein n=1 Tax=Lentilactobacillus kosonis TaxID=2810561 RepID=A0A401FJL5_9LACO|nr:hypothetical protein NBRC111893_663 [Lentilactobacillus kosonis]
MGCTLLLNGARWSTVALGLIAILNLITYNFTMQADFDIWVSGFIILTILGIVNKFLVGGRNM